MIFSPGGACWTRGSTLCKIARRSSARWQAVQYAGQRDGSAGEVYMSFSATRQYATDGIGERSSDVVGSITTNAAHETSIDSILEQLPEGAVKPGDDQSLSQLLLLLTPSYAQHAFDASLPLKVLERLRGGKEWNQSLRTTTAVVDRISANDSKGKDGVEGLAYLWKDGISKLDITKSIELPAAAQKPGWLDVEMSDQSSQRGTQSSMALQLPLARTIFTNGKVSTLVQATYRPDSSGQLRLERQHNLESCRFTLASSAGGRLPQLHAPLVPLTRARKIGNIMGNIIRSVSTEPSFSGSMKPSDETQPASEELEQAVTAFFTAADIAPQPVSVWALIIPSPLAGAHTADHESTYRLLGSQDEDLRSLWKSGSSCTSTVNAALNHLMPAGARLRKVLSGGGGWGKKAGLLSLDPDDRYSTRELRQEAGWEMDFNDDPAEQQKQALGEAAKKWESVMFFLAPEGLAGYASGTAMENSEGSGELAASFGTLPSSIDYMPATSGAAGSGQQATVRHHSGFFGALSEEGLALTLTSSAGVATKTKFDVPYSRVDLRRSVTSSNSGQAPSAASGKRHYSTAPPRKRKDGKQRKSSE